MKIKNVRVLAALLAVILGISNIPAFAMDSEPEEIIEVFSDEAEVEVAEATETGVEGLTMDSSDEEIPMEIFDDTVVFSEMPDEIQTETSETMPEEIEIDLSDAVLSGEENPSDEEISSNPSNEEISSDPDEKDASSFGDLPSGGDGFSVENAENPDGTENIPADGGVSDEGETGSNEIIENLPENETENSDSGENILPEDNETKEDTDGSSDGGEDEALMEEAEIVADEEMGLFSLRSLNTMSLDEGEGEVSLDNLPQEYEGYLYIECADGCAIVGYHGEQTELSIPSAIGELPVIAIETGAFMENERITSVVIPGSVVSIGESAFENCVSLEKVSIQGDVCLGDYCFAGCAALKTITILGNALEISTTAFDGLSGIAFSGNGECAVAIGQQTMNICDFVWQNGFSVDAEACITFDASEMNLSVRETGAITGSITPAGVQIAWKSNDENIALVNDKGIVTGVSAGDAVITAYCVNKTEICAEITVHVSIPQIEGIIPVTEKVILSAGDTYSLLWDYEPQYAQGSVSFDSSDPLIAEVDEKGAVTAVSQGTAVITATADSGATASFNVQVRPLPMVVALSPATLTLGAGQSKKLTVAFQAGTGSKCTFSSSDENVATVDEYGRVKAEKKGTAVITVETVNGKTASMRLTVKAAPEAVEISKKNISIGVGDQYALSAEVLPVKIGALIWQEKDSGIAEVSASGVVTANSIGNTQVSVTTYNGKTDVCNVSVLAAPTTMRFVQEEIMVGAGGQIQLPELITDSEGLTISSTYTSSDARFATVDAAGIVRGVKAGTVTITAMAYNDITATCKVTVYNAPSGVSISLPRTQMGVGEKETVSVSVPAGSLAWYRYSSSDTAVATISANGEIQAKNPGRTKITVTTQNDKTDYLWLRVRPAPTSIDLPDEIPAIGFEQEYRIKPVLNSYSASKITYSVVPEGAIEIDASGRIYAKETGFVQLTASTFNGLSDTCTLEIRPAPSCVYLNITDMVIGAGQRSIDPLEVILGENGEYCAGSYTLSSSNTKCATVDANGYVRGVSAGTAVITARSHNGMTAECQVTVLAAPDKITVTPDVIRVPVGETIQLQVGLPENTLTKLSFRSNANGVATVDENGLVKTVGVGKAQIVVTTHNGKRDVVDISVCYPPLAVTLSPKILKIGEGMRMPLTAKINAGSAGSVSFESSNNAAIAVDENGMVTAGKNAAGEEALITVKTYNGKTDTAKVMVVAGPDVISLSESSVVMCALEDAHQIEYSIPDGTMTSIRFESEDASVATVSETGLIRALAPGKIKVHVIASNGISAAVDVEVKSYSQMYPPHTVAHRGASAHARENSLEAVKKARAMGAKHVEVDIRRTKDGKIVLAHDAKEKADNGTNYVIANNTLSKLKSVKFGGTRIATLEELLAYMSGTDMTLWLEFKVTGIEAQAVALLKKYGMLERTYSVCSSTAILNNIKAADSSAKRMWVYNTLRSAENVKKIVTDYDYDGVVVLYSVITLEVCRAMHEMDKIVAVSTVNSESVMRNMIAKEVDFIGTDYVDRGMRVMGQ